MKFISHEEKTTNYSCLIHKFDLLSVLLRSHQQYIRGQASPKKVSK